MALPRAADAFNPAYGRVTISHCVWGLGGQCERQEPPEDHLFVCFVMSAHLTPAQSLWPFGKGARWRGQAAAV